MGSRSRRHAALIAARAALVAASVSGCTSGPPPGFSSGDRWTIPLIGPVEDGLLLVPALVDGKGPFVFALDPDANVSIVDEQVVKEAGLRTGEGPRMVDEHDTTQPEFYAEVLEWTLGTLTVKQKPAEVVRASTFDSDGRRIHGVIGRDILADSLVFAFDRDAGAITLTTTKAFSPPAGATALGWDNLSSGALDIEVAPIPRRLVHAKIGDAALVMHVDLGATASQLRSRSWDKVGLVAGDASGIVVDETGRVRDIKKQGVAATVTVGALTSSNVTFVPYDDRRWPDEDLEGTLGLGFWQPYSLAASWDAKKLYATPRRDLASTLAERIGRWQSKTLARCEQPGCVTVALIDPLAGKPADQLPAQHPGIVASITRDGSAMALDFEVLIAITPAEGKPPLKWLVANLPRGTEKALTHLSPDYVGATARVVDIGLFPRACPSDGSCVDQVKAPR